MRKRKAYFLVTDWHIKWYLQYSQMFDTVNIYFKVPVVRQLNGAWFQYNSQSALLQDLKNMTPPQGTWPQHSFDKILQKTPKIIRFFNNLIEWTFEVKTLRECSKITSVWNYVDFILFLLVICEIFRIYSSKRCNKFPLKVLPTLS
jgi:hypothetical protein